MTYDPTLTSRSTMTTDLTTASDVTHAPVAGFHWRPGERLLDDIILHESIGEGGMGVVYRASHVVTRQEFAVKRVKSALPTHHSTLTNFYAELVSWLDAPQHPHILPCHFFRTIAGELVIFTDFMPGGSLAARIATGKPLPLSETLRVAFETASATAALHLRGLVHQDIKPANVLLGIDGSTRLADFGLARAAAVIHDDEAQPASALVTWRGMTRAYCSPEQAARQRLGPASDVFSWAAMLVHLLVGRIEWQAGPDLVDVMPELLIRKRGDDLPADLVALISACLERDVQKRPTMESIARELSNGDAAALPIAATSEVGRSDGTHQFQRHLMTSRVLIGPIYWELRASIDLNDRPVREQVEVTNQRARLASDIDKYLRYTELYRDAVPDRPELRSRLQQLLLETALAQEEAGDLGAAANAAEEALALGDARSPDERGTIDAAVTAAHILVKSGRFRIIIEKLRPLAEAARPDNNPLVIRVLVQLANACSDVGEFSEARSWYERALKSIPENGRNIFEALSASQIHHELAVLAKRTGNPDEALQQINQAIALSEREELQSQPHLLGSSLYLKGTLLTDIGRHEEALATYDRSVAVLTAGVELGGASLDIEAVIARSRMSRSISLHRLGRSSEALADLDYVIEMRKAWYDRQGRSEFGDELARVYLNKAMVLEGIGDLKGGLECQLQAYALYKQIEESGRRDVRREFAALMGRMAESFWRLGAEDQARELLGPAAFLTEQLANDAALAEPTRRQLRSTLVTRYYQMYQLSENLPDVADESGAREMLLDMTLSAATTCMKQGASLEVMIRYIEAATDKAMLLHQRKDEEGADKVMGAAIGLYQSIAQSPRGLADAREMLPAVLRAGSSWAIMVHPSAPQRALTLIDYVLGEIRDSENLPVELLGQLGMTWLARSRICRDAAPAELEKSTEEAFHIWRTAVGRSEVPAFLSTATYIASEHIEWCRRVGKNDLATRGATAMLDILSDAAQRTGRSDLEDGVAKWRQHYAEILS